MLPGSGGQAHNRDLTQMRHDTRLTFGTLIVAASAGLLLAACGSLGPSTLDKDQLDYGASVGENWKNQMLANVVKLRYVDMPVFIDVGQIVSGYTLQTQISGRLGFGDSITGSNNQGLGAGGSYTDRPTITYMPKTGENYLRSLLEPVAPSAVLALTLAGYSPQLLFNWAVESINGVRNYSATRGMSNASADPKFVEFVELLGEMRHAGAIGFEVDKATAAGGHDVILFFSNRSLDEATRAKQRRLRQLIGMAPEPRQFKIIYSPFAVDDANVLAIQTRSILQTLYSMAGFVDVPPDKEARAGPGYNLAAAAQRPFHVRTGKHRPGDAYAVFHYDGDWYWIDHNDLESKKVFTLMLFLTTLTNRAQSENAPVLTIPTS